MIKELKHYKDQAIMSFTNPWEDISLFVGIVFSSITIVIEVLAQISLFNKLSKG